MPKLKNPKYEAFAARVATGESLVDAYHKSVSATCKTAAARVSAQRLINQPSIDKRIDELRAMHEKRVEEMAHGAVVQIESSLENTAPVILARNLVERVQRVQLLCEYVEKIEQAFRERAADPDHIDVPGMSTGLVAVKWKITKNQTEKEYEIDTAALRELRGHQEQIAKELGQWVEKQDQVQSVKSVRDIPESVLEDMLKASKDEDSMEKPN